MAINEYYIPNKSEDISGRFPFMSKDSKPGYKTDLEAVALKRANRESFDRGVPVVTGPLKTVFSHEEVLTQYGFSWYLHSLYKGLQSDSSPIQTTHLAIDIPFDDNEQPDKGVLTIPERLRKVAAKIEGGITNIKVLVPVSSSEKYAQIIFDIDYSHFSPKQQEAILRISPGTTIIQRVTPPSLPTGEMSKKPKAESDVDKGQALYIIASTAAQRNQMDILTFAESLGLKRGAFRETMTGRRPL